MTARKAKSGASKSTKKKASPAKPAPPAHAPRPAGDGCDLHVTAADATRDEDLPAAEGGIA